MKIKEQCLACLVNQSVKTANLVGIKNREELYNQMFLEKAEVYEEKKYSIEDAVKYAIVANIIDFNPVHANVEADIKTYFSSIEQLELTINNVDKLMDDVQRADSILYLGDCG